jgi:hypothetical protein
MSKKNLWGCKNACVGERCNVAGAVVGRWGRVKQRCGSEERDLWAGEATVEGSELELAGGLCGVVFLKRCRAERQTLARNAPHGVALNQRTEFCSARVGLVVSDSRPARRISSS